MRGKRRQSHIKPGRKADQRGGKKKKRTVQNEPACNDDDTHDICEINCLFIPSSRVRAV